VATNVQRVAFALSLVALAAVSYVFFTRQHPYTDAIDFRSFYCAARAVSADRSPYLAEPLRTCEETLEKVAHAPPLPVGLAIPAPLPGYALALFLPLARLPYVVANLVFDLLLLGASIFAVALLARLTGLPLLVIAPSIALSLTFQSWRFGQIVPLVLALLVVAAASLERARYTLAAAALGVAMIEPHVASPAVLSALIVVPRMRLRVSIALALLAAVSLGTLGLDQNVLYLRDVLPAHAAAELGMNGYQFSLTNLLHQLGVADHAALALGELSYIVMLVAGITISSSLARQTGRPALLLLGPSALALVGGPFLHLVQIVCALPFALLLLALFPRNRVILLATLLLAAPWLEFIRNSDPPSVALCVALCILPIAWYALHERPLQVAVVTLALVALGAGIAGFAYTIHLSKIDATAALARVKDGRLLAEVSWSTYVRTVLSRDPPSYLLEKLPTWIGLCALLIGAAAQATAPWKEDAAPHEPSVALG